MESAKVVLEHPLWVQSQIPGSILIQASECAGPAAGSGGSHGRTQGHQPDCPRNKTNDVTDNSQCLSASCQSMINK